MRRFSTVNKAEVSKFTRAASDWWKPESNTGVGLLHQLNPIRVQYIREQAITHFKKEPLNAQSAWPLKGRRVLDVGCGGGILSEALARLGANVTGVDPGQANIEAATTHALGDHETANNRYICSTADALVQQKETFEIVCALEVVEHVDDVPAFIQQLTQLVEPNGVLFMSTISRTALSYLTTILAVEHVLRLVPPGTHEWSKYVQTHELTAALEQNGMRVENVSGIVGDPFITGWRLSERCTDINYILCATKKE
ncbi:3-demethylubiquinone-9 3-O-methyltransferase [Saprolegnia parasitica CBS 223.65]|uniref:Ubiquinone biosynthesis O-methyltransferase, mitochondrial n=2 Tax=Saprolegnia parasitica (strain CBS 223.65) TaxID=695850 RepID=A0A067CLN9_SAPPC|nr:3-demethylubiquinone-9 3-O-methyltransferase [Saprolegnia parasitica CBS 223.65]KDO30125.1 3-demethylubiquinone-9 3-O-methyltransferase [Saprolegnia parasitica CBS 223.65]|eukprot:XP_012199304.1 3-demethylubiquinone-9 3-O-methyltransferase [Saprolegnia parasitica CBS 223.65]